MHKSLRSIYKESDEERNSKAAMLMSLKRLVRAAQGA